MDGKKLEEVRKKYAECRKWAFTFGVGHGLRHYYVVIEGTYDEAKDKMIELFGKKWSWQYPLDEWEAKGYDTKPLNDYIEIGGLEE